MVQMKISTRTPHRLIGLTVIAVLIVGSLSLTELSPAGPATPAQAAAISYGAPLSGPAESPPNNSPGTGETLVALDLTAHTLRVQVQFSGLVAGTTASHIHACTAAPGTGTAGIATQVPTFTGFPLGVTSGSYIHTFDTLDPTSYNPGFLIANGGTAASAEAALAACLDQGRAYLNVHSTVFPGGEIRGFLLTAPQLVTNLQGFLSGLPVTPAGISTSLQAKLTEGASCGQLQALIHEAEAQAGKKLTAAQASQISADATRIRAVLGC